MGTPQVLLGAVLIEFAGDPPDRDQRRRSTVTREKEDGTLDLLLSSPITSRTTSGASSAAVSFVLPLVAVPVGSVLIFVIYDVFAVEFLDDPLFKWSLPEAVVLMPRR